VDVSVADFNKVENGNGAIGHEATSTKVSFTAISFESELVV
jgi:DNA-directed RNA polymerase subunit E'/Rpb7